MSKNTDLINKRITGFLTDIHAFKDRVGELEDSIQQLKKEVSRQKLLAKKYREEKTRLKKEIGELKDRLGSGD